MGRLVSITVRCSAIPGCVSGHQGIVCKVVLKDDTERTVRKPVQEIARMAVTDQQGIALMDAKMATTAPNALTLALYIVMGNASSTRASATNAEMMNTADTVPTASIPVL